jgi:ABC-type multidrug transport system ATPase subunit
MHIQLDKLGKWYAWYSSIWALRDVTMEIAPGQVVALLGPNGAGKTTLLRCLAGLVVPSCGRILYDGEPFSRQRIDLRRRFLFLSDLPLFFSTYDVIRRIAIALALYEKDVAGVEQRVAELLDEFDLTPKEDSACNQLSRGQAYKASLVALLAVDPEVWLLDEPLASGMDPHGIMAFKRHAGAAAARGRTVIYSTQILDAAESFSDRVCVLDDGQVRAFERLDQLRQAGASDGGSVLESLFKRLREESP